MKVRRIQTVPEILGFPTLSPRLKLKGGVPLEKGDEQSIRCQSAPANPESFKFCS